MNKLVSLFLLMSLMNCIEPFEIDTNVFESYLVVNTTVTNELKNHEVKLSRAFRVNEGEANPESGAIISVVTSTGLEYSFTESLESGTYVSNEQFEVLSGVSYQLKITTNDGSEYQSLQVETPEVATMDNVYAARTFNESGVLGVGIFVDTSVGGDEGAYFRYEYEETYQVVAPEWRETDLVEFDLFFSGTRFLPLYTFEPRSTGEQVCYNTNESTEIITSNTNSLQDNQISNYYVKFIESTDISVSERYSINLTQYVQTREANRFYETIKSFNATDNLFSQVQTGFIDGNISSLSNENEKVFGFFNVSTVSYKRIFFNRADIFENDDYEFYDCVTNIPTIDLGETVDEYIERVNELLMSDGLRYLDNPVPFPSPNSGYIRLINKSCGDCNFYGESERPSFWED